MTWPMLAVWLVAPIGGLSLVVLIAVVAAALAGTPLRPVRPRWRVWLGLVLWIYVIAWIGAGSVFRLDNHTPAGLPPIGAR